MNQNPAIQQNPENPVDPAVIQPKKKAKQSFALKPQHFQKQKGIKSLYKALQKLDLTKGQDNETLTMKKVVVLLKTWHFQMLPRYSFDYFLQRCRILGNNKFTQSYMAKVRKIHKSEQRWINQQAQQVDPLNNIDLAHLNPHSEVEALNSQQIIKKLQIANNFLYKSQPHTQHKKQVQSNKKSEKMQIQSNKKMQIQDNHMFNFQDSQQDEDFNQLFKMMDNLEKNKKEIFGKQKNQSYKKQQTQPTQRQKNQSNKQHQPKDQSQQESIPYIPQGFDSIDYQNESADQ